MRRGPGLAGRRPSIPRVLLVMLLLPACIHFGPPPAHGGRLEPPSPPFGPDGQRIVRIGSFDFPESELLARIYALALKAKGYPVRLDLRVGSREIVEPALQQGFLDFVPEYLGSALQFVHTGNESATSSVGLTHDRLVAVMASRGIAVLAPAPAQNQNAIVVRDVTANSLDLREISDLVAKAPDLVFGGPPECLDRPLCMRGLERAYGLSFKEFIPLDAGGPYTVAALEAGDVDVALLFSTDGHIQEKGFVILGDDRRLQPAENVTPVVRKDVLDEYGARFGEVVDEVSAAITTAKLAALNQRVAVDGIPPGQVAASWIREQGLGG